MSRTKVLLKNTIIMTVFSVGVSAFIMLFNSYISKKIGAEEMGVFTLIMSVYTFAQTVAISGINLASTRLTAEEIVLGREGNLTNVVKKCLAYGLFFGILASVLMGIGSDFLGERILHSDRAAAPLRMLAFALPFISVSSILAGYFNAKQQVTRNSVGALLEQLIKFVACMILFNWGISCFTITIAITIAEICGSIYRLMVYIFSRKGQKAYPSDVKVTNRMLKIALPVALSSYLKSILTSVKQIVVPIFLVMFGLDRQSAMREYGVIQGMALPLLLFPACILIALSTLLIPEIAQLHVREKNVRITSAITRIFKATMLFSIGVCGVLFFFADELSNALYADSAVAPILRVLAFSVPVMYFDNIVDGLLKGLDRQVSVVWINIIDSIATIIMFATILPRLGVAGYIVVFFLSELLNAFLSIYCLLKTAACRFKVKEWVVKPAICIAVALLIVGFLPRCNFTIRMLLTVGFYILGLWWTGSLRD